MDTSKKSVRINGRYRLSYNKLLLATGSRPNIPAGIEGKDVDGIFALRKLSDARAMAQRAESTEHA